MKYYQNQTVVLVTKHHKDTVIRPLMEAGIGCYLKVENGYDTDLLGTFSREIKRPKSQLDTARLKIKKGLRLSQGQIGMATEGSFGRHPYLPVPWHVELVLFYDYLQKIEVYGVYESCLTNFAHTLLISYEDLEAFACEIGFPEHGIILRPNHERSKPIIKDMDDYETLKKAYEHCVACSMQGFVFAETDMRAHKNPTRMLGIEKATEQMLSKLTSLCPDCSFPGFSILEKIKGLPCEGCGLPSELTKVHIYRCIRCGFSHEVTLPDGPFAPAQYCHYCNP